MSDKYIYSVFMRFTQNILLLSLNEIMQVDFKGVIKYNIFRKFNEGDLTWLLSAFLKLSVRIWLVRQAHIPQVRLQLPILQEK